MLLNNPAGHRTVLSQQRIVWPKMSMVMRLRNPDLDFSGDSGTENEAELMKVDLIFR